MEHWTVRVLQRHWRLLFSLLLPPAVYLQGNQCSWRLSLPACARLHQLRASSLSGHEGFCQGTIRHKGKRVERLPVRMLLLRAILASDLQGAEEKSSIPRLLLTVFLPHCQIHRSDLPAGGAFGLDTSKDLSLVATSPGEDLIKLPALTNYLSRDITSPKDRSQVCSKVEQNLFKFI